MDVVRSRRGRPTCQAARGIRNVETQLSDKDFAAMVQLEGLSKGTSRRSYVQKSVEDVLVAGLSLFLLFFLFFFSKSSPQLFFVNARCHRSAVRG